jgi:hypothetical protein
VQRTIAWVVMLGAVSTSRAATIATEAPPAPEVSAASIDDDPPRDIVLGRFLFEPYVVTTESGRSAGGRFGIDMVNASGEGATRLAGGIRFLLGGDGAGGFGPEGQIMVGGARALGSRAVVALVAPLGFTVNTEGKKLSPHAYAGIEGIGAAGPFEAAAGVSNRGARARVGFIRRGRELGFSVGVDWQRDGDTELFGVYVATTSGVMPD